MPVLPWQVLVRLLGPGGPDLRQFYLPGLEGLKQQLRMLEWLMERVMGRLKDYLEARPRACRAPRAHSC